jgi:hypothetical protein
MFTKAYMWQPWICLFFHTENEDMDGNVSGLASASQAGVSLSGDSSSWQSLRKEKNDGNCVEVLRLAAKYRSPTMKGNFSAYAKYVNC